MIEATSTSSLDKHSRDHLVTVLKQHCTNQPWRDVSRGRSMIGFGLILTVVWALMWLAWSAFEYSQDDDPDHGIHYVRDAIQAGERDGRTIAFLVQIQEKDRRQAELTKSRDQSIAVTFLAILGPVVT